MNWWRQTYDQITKLILRLPKKWYLAMLCITFLGGAIFITIVTSIILICGLVLHRPNIWRLGILIIVTHLIVTFLKLLFRRPRPNTEYARKIRFSKYSFPSGHSAVGLVSWYSVALLIAMANVPMILLIVISLLAPILVFWIGISRIYLGAHFLIDVLVGWLIGLAMIISYLFLVLK